MQTTQIFLTRHGETGWNAEQRMQGHLDSPLTATGIAQAQALANSLVGQRFSALYSSDLGRAYRTAQYLAEVVSLEILTDSRLREKKLGLFQGLTRSELIERFPQEFRNYQDDPNFVVPEGESTTQFFDRCVICFNDIARQHPREKVLVVTHGGVLNQFFRYVLNIPLDAPRKFSIFNTSLNIFSYQNESWTLESWGNLNHLQSLKTLDEL
jgi:probable phosphoglycerate mutase